MTTLTAESLLAGALLRHEITLREDLWPLVGEHGPDAPTVIVRPLTVGDLQRIAHASGGDDERGAVLMIQHALCEPRLDFEQASGLPAGVALFLVEQIGRVSGIDASPEHASRLAAEPLAGVLHLVARTYGWTAEQVSGMTVGQLQASIVSIAEDEAVV